MNLVADEQQKKRVARAAMTGTAGGRVLLALTALLLVLALGCPAVVGAWMEGEGAESIGLRGAEGLEWALAFFFLAMAFMCGAIAWRTRNRRCALRSEERVIVDGGVLWYQYTEEVGRANAAQEGFGEGALGTRFQRTVAVDLARAGVSYQRALREWAFDGAGGGIRGMDAAHPQGRELAAFEIGDYFGPELSEFLQRYARG